MKIMYKPQIEITFIDSDDHPEDEQLANFEEWLGQWLSRNYQAKITRVETDEIDEDDDEVSPGL